MLNLSLLHNSNFTAVNYNVTFHRFQSDATERERERLSSSRSMMYVLLLLCHSQNHHHNELYTFFVIKRICTATFL